MIKNLYIIFIKTIAELLSPLPIVIEQKKWEKRNIALRLLGLNIGKNVRIGPDFLTINGLENNISIGDYTDIGYANKFYSFNKIIIVKFNMFAANIEIVNGGHNVNNLEPFSKPIIIGNGCWFGHGVKIIKGVTIGNNVIIGGGSVVIDDIPDNAIAVGVPAKVIKYRELPDKVWHLGNEYFCPKTFELIKD
ncbi:MAG TPA: acyltransferase [Leptospiraceae bacterium]|nr:acyltransferase [Leptospiraceae bacterium]HNA08841.1 acyltransferase [Leptospiraceae bacterium]HNF56916.1 acyltransferase [Leptospiraceae bacterium]HNH57099.1 acyltransferase [Leptospiraceae bacterium]HNK95106.1 acyltransferase [Leptospiraceae bacterium]